LVEAGGEIPVVVEDAKVMAQVQAAHDLTMGVSVELGGSLEW